MLSETSLKYQGHGSRATTKTESKIRRNDEPNGEEPIPNLDVIGGPMTSHIVPFAIQVNHGRNSCESIMVI